MQETKFNYVVSNDNTLVSPDTGTYTSMSASSNINNTTNAMNSGNNYLLYGTIIFSLILIIFSIVSIIRKKNRFKSSMNEAIKHKTNVALVILATILLSSSFIALIANITNYTTATTIPNDNFTTKKDVTTTVTLDKTDSVTACATDTITMANALAGGYTLNFTASNIDPAISSITEYELTIDDETTPTTITPDDTITIKDITTATSAGDTTDVTLCISFPADTEPGTYTVTGAYDSTVEIYSVVWKNYDGTVLYEDNSVSRGTTPEYGGTIPVKPADAQYTYTFNGWTPEVAVATEDTTYTATYTQQVVNYTITYDLADGTLPTGATNPTTYNVETDTFTLINPERTNYTFTGWTGSNGTTPQTTVTVAKGTTGNLNYVANWDCSANQICYDDNGANSPTTMSNQSISSSATSRDLRASNFQRSGYGFAGWNTKADGTGTSYGPNETITLTPGQLSTAGLRLYAIWIPSAGNLQNWNGCNAMNIGDVTALTDQRDNNTYAIAKLADNKCWMIENLRLDSTAELTTTNTNNPLNNAGTVTIKNSDGNTTNHLSASTNPTTTAWCTNFNAACYDQSMVFTGNTTNTVSNMTSANANIYSYGNYYNWYSATAGNGTYSFNTENNSVNGSICPAGWHLPKGGNKTRIEANDDNDYWNLIVDSLNNGTLPANYTSNAYPYYTGNPEGTDVSKLTRSYPNNFIYSGYVHGSSVIARGGEGDYWTSTAYSSYRAYVLHLNSSYVYPGAYDWLKGDGGSVRCLMGV